MEGGKLENPEKNPRSRDENQQQIQPTFDAETGNRTTAPTLIPLLTLMWATLDIVWDGNTAEMCE